MGKSSNGCECGWCLHISPAAIAHRDFSPRTKAPVMTGTWDAPTNIQRPAVLINTIQDRNCSLGVGGREPVRAYITTVHEKRSMPKRCMYVPQAAPFTFKRLDCDHAVPSLRSARNDHFIFRYAFNVSHSRCWLRGACMPRAAVRAVQGWRWTGDRPGTGIRCG